MDDSGNRTVLILVERIVRLADAAEVLVHRRHDRPAQRLPRIPRIEETRVVGGNRQRQRARLAAHRMALILRQTDHPPQSLHIADAVAKLPVPILPFFEGGVREETLPEGSAPGCRLKKPTWKPVWPARRRVCKWCSGTCQNHCTGLDRQCRSTYLEALPPPQKESHFPSVDASSNFY